MPPKAYIIKGRLSRIQGGSDVYRALADELNELIETTGAVAVQAITVLGEIQEYSSGTPNEGHQQSALVVLDIPDRVDGDA